MAWQEIKFQLTSLTPGMIMHNGQTADPLNKFTRALKQVTSKRKKVDSDHEEMAHLEFLAGLYLDDSGPVIPAPNLEAMIQRAAMKVKEGQYAKSGVFCLNHAPLMYDGSHIPEDLFQDERFRLTVRARVGQASVMRTRPLFRDWKATITFMVEDEIVNLERVAVWMKIAGAQIGLGDWRPRYGRFEAVQV